MREIDNAVKKISSWYPNCILDLCYGQKRIVELQGVEDTQIQIPEHRTDKFWRVREGAKEACLMLEAITEPDGRDYPRINLKSAAARVTLKVPVVTVLVYLQKQLARKFGPMGEETQGSLQKLSGEAVDALAIELFDLQTLDDLQMWLKQARKHGNA